MLSVDKLPAGKSCRIAVQVIVDKGWHINTNPAKPDTFVPTELKIKSKQGVTLRDVKYPPATKKIEVPGLKEAQEVYEENFIIYGVLDVPGDPEESQDELEIDVKYQACNVQACLPPRTYKLSGKLAIAGPNEEVRQINQDKFAKSGEKSKSGN